MHIDKHLDVINACRFCFMCRHLDTVGNVSFRESDTPRGRALVVDKMRMDKANLGNSDFVDTLYRSALSAACRFHCVSHYDEAGLVLAARKDVVEAGFAPEKVKKLASELEKAEFKVKGKGPDLYLGTHPELYAGHGAITGGDPGKALEVLGFIDASERVFAKFRKAVGAAKCKNLVVAEPAIYEFLKDKLDGVKVMHVSEYLLKAGMQKGRHHKTYFLESDFIKNYCGAMTAPRMLVGALGFQVVPFGTNVEESYSVGEGAVVYDRLNPVLCEKMCLRIARLAGDLKTASFITPSQYVADTLRKYVSGIKIKTIEEIIK